MPLQLVIGNKTYSSWSMRPWIAMRANAIPFEEIVIPLYAPGSKEAILRHSPAGKVPVLIDGPAQVWESLAILDYLAARFPDAALWPQQPAAGALARSIAAEMHAGFLPLRRFCPMNLNRAPALLPLSDEVKANVARIDAAWSDARARFGAGGPFLFGKTFGAADAMYAPVVMRFHLYAVPVSAPARAYMDAVMALPAWREWGEGAARETWRLPDLETVGVVP